MMEFAEATEIIRERLKLEGYKFSAMEEVALEAAWEGIKYKEISELKGVNFNSLQGSAGPKLWKDLSKIYNFKVTKTSFKTFFTEILHEGRTDVLYAQQPRLSEEAAVVAVEPPVLTIPVIGAALPHTEKFYGRQKELKELGVLLDKHSCILVVGSEGVGKKSLVAHFLHDAALPFSQIVWKPLHHRPENLEAELLRLLGEAVGSSLVSYFRARKSIIVFESIDALITRQGGQSDLDPNVMSLIRRIVEETESKVIMISNEPIEQIRNMMLRGNAMVYPLHGLLLREAKALMGGDLGGHLEDLCKFTGGNPLMLKRISQWQQTQAAASLGPTMAHRLTVHRSLFDGLHNQILASQSLSKIDRQLLESIASEEMGISYRQLLHLYPNAVQNIQRLLEMGLVRQTFSTSGDVIVQVYEFLRQHLLAQKTSLPAYM